MDQKQNLESAKQCLDNLMFGVNPFDAQSIAHLKVGDRVVINILSTVRDLIDGVNVGNDEALKAALSARMADLQEAEKKLADIKEELVAADEKIKVAENRATEAETKLAVAEERIAAAEERQAAAEQHSNEAQDCLSSAQGRVAKAEDDAAQAKENARLADVRTAEAEKQAATLEERIAQAKESEAQVRALAQQATDRARDLEERLAFAEVAKSSAEERLAAAQEALEAAEEKTKKAKEKAKEAADRADAAENAMLVMREEFSARLEAAVQASKVSAAKHAGMDIVDGALPDGEGEGEYEGETFDSTYSADFTPEDISVDWSQLPTIGTQARSTKAAAATPPKYKKPNVVVPSEYEITLRGRTAAVPITKKKIQLARIQANINKAFFSQNVSISLNKLTALLKDADLLAMSKAGAQTRLCPTKTGEYYGMSLSPVVEEGVTKMLTVFNDRAQLLVLQLVSEEILKKATFEYIPDLIKCVPVTETEVSLSEIVVRINDTYKNNNMTKLTFDTAAKVLVEHGVMQLNPDGTNKPKYIPCDGMRKNGIFFYPADARYAARTAFNDKGQRYVLKMLAWLIKE